MPLCVVLASAACVVVTACKKQVIYRVYPPATSPAALATLLEVVGVRDSPSKEYDLEIRDRDGRTWYRTRDPIVNWLDLDTRKIRVEKAADEEGFVVVLVASEQGGDRMVTWTMSHMGERLAICVDGTIHQSATINAAIRTNFCFSGFDTEHEATRMADYFRNPASGKPPG